MPDNPLTMFALAGLEESDAIRPLSAGERRRLVESLQKKASEVAALSRFELGHRLLGLLGDAMQAPVSELLKEYWKQRAELKKLTAKDESRRDVVGEVELIDHSWTSKLEPSIDVLVDGVRVHTVHLTVTLKLTLEGVVLEMKNACITAVKGGTLKADTTLTYDTEGPKAEHFQLAPAIHRELKLPGHLTIPRGGICLS